MPSTSWTQDLGTVAASGVASITLDARPDLPRSAQIRKATIRNSSNALITLVNHPGQPTVDPGDRQDVEECGRYMNFQNDANAIAAGDVKVTITAEWP
ncbi:MAG: hypothetical protein ABR586_01295 [Thermoplasmatota archaeon]